MSDCREAAGGVSRQTIFSRTIASEPEMRN